MAAVIVWIVFTGGFSPLWLGALAPIGFFTYVQANARIEISETTVTYRDPLRTVTLDNREPVELQGTRGDYDAQPDFYIAQGDRRIRINEAYRDAHLLFAELTRLWPTLPKLYLLGNDPPRGPYR